MTGTIHRPQKILFVCTGNIFRSMIAEHALRKWLPEASGIVCSSAGLTAQAQPIHTAVRERLLELKIDPARHVQRRLTTAISSEVDLAVAMGLDHQEALRRDFGLEAPLFLEWTRGEKLPIRDVWEIIPDHETNHAAVRAYVRRVVGTIYEAAREVVKRWPVAH